MDIHNVLKQTLTECINDSVWKNYVNPMHIEVVDKRVRAHKPSQRFWRLWRFRKDKMNEMGVYVSKYRGKYVANFPIHSFVNKELNRDMINFMF